MKVYPRRTQWAIRTIILLLVSQIIFALIIAPAVGIEDFFPFHRWALFAKASKGFSVPIVYIHSYGVEKFDPPVNYYDFFANRSDIFFLSGRDHLIFWHEAKDRGNYERANQEFQAFIDDFFKNSEAVFSIRFEKLDQVEFRKSRKVIETLKTYGPFQINADGDIQ